MSLARGSTHKLPHMTTKASAYPCSAVPAYSRVSRGRLSLVRNILHDTDENKVLNIYSNVNFFFSVIAQNNAAVDFALGLKGRVHAL